MTEAAQPLLAAATASAQVLAQTEITKDRLLARIEQVLSLGDVHALDEAISALANADRGLAEHPNGEN